MLFKEAKNAQIEWKAVSSAIITATLRMTRKKGNINAVHCYRPTHDKDESVKEEFYRKPQSQVDDRCWIRHIVTIVEK